MAEVKLGARLRTNTRRSYSHFLRDKGRIPAVVYGKGIREQAIELDVRDLESIIRKKGRNALIDLEIQGESDKNDKHIVMIKELQRDSIRREIVHADLCKVSLENKIRTVIPIILKGEAARKPDGGTVQTGARELEIECRPDKVPDSVVLDISGLNIGQHLSVEDIPVSGEYSILTESDKVLVSVAAARAAEGAEEEGEIEKEEPVKGETVKQETEDKDTGE